MQQMHPPPKMNPPSSNDNIMSNADCIAAALADLESQAVPNYKTTAKKHEVVYIILIKWVYKKNYFKLKNINKILINA